MRKGGRTRTTAGAAAVIALVLASCGGAAPAGLPRAGCWRLVLAWGGHRAAIDVQVAPARAASVPGPAAAAARKVGRKPPVVYVVRHGTTRAVRIGTGSVVAPADRAVPPAGGSCSVPKDI